MVYIFSKIVFVIAFGSSSDIKTSCSLGFWQSTHSNWAFSVKLCRFDQIQMEWCALLFQNNTTIPHLWSSWPHFYVHIHFVSNSDIGGHQWIENRKDIGTTYYDGQTFGLWLTEAYRWTAAFTWSLVLLKRWCE